MEYAYTSYNIETLDFDNEKVKSKIYKWNDTVSYTILNNDSSTMSFAEETLKNYRSVILDDNNHILCFAPPNSIPSDQFIQKYSGDTSCGLSGNGDVIPEDVYMNEIIEGTMINLFYDPRISSWQIATRGAIGGNYWFFRNNYSDDEASQTQKTFKQMFMECFATDATELNAIPFLESLPKNYSYSFVLQHPDNHIVLNVERPTLYLVAVYDKRETTVHNIPQPVYEAWDIFANVRGIIEFPPRFSEPLYSELISKYCSVQSSYNRVGVMATHMKTGERCAISNPAYEELKKLRGNNPNLQYQYFALEQSGQTQLFLQHFPMYKKLFFQFSKQYQDFITNVHQSYFSYYVKKEGIPIAKKFFIHASSIHHNVFLPSITSGEKKIITRNIVKDYFDAMTPSEKLYYLNYDKRQLAKEKRKLKDQGDASAQGDLSASAQGDLSAHGYAQGAEEGVVGEDI